MQHVLTQAQVESEVYRLQMLLEKDTIEFAALAEGAANAEADHKGAYARAILGSTHNRVAERQADAELQTSELYRTRKVMEARSMAARESMRSLQSQLSALQSILRGIKDLT